MELLYRSPIFTRCYPYRTYMKIFSKYAVAFVLSYLLFAWLGCKKDEIRFNLIAPSGGDTTTFQGIYNVERGDSAYNTVFLDFSKDQHPAVLRSSWDLGFYCGTADFRVIINNAVGATLVESDKTNLNDVTLNDSTTTLFNKLDLAATGDPTTIDAVTGDSTAYLAGTVIKKISAVNSENKVYILKRGTGTTTAYSKWIKMRIDRSTTSNGYIVTYGNLPDQTYRTITVTKDASFNFTYASFATATSSYEPAKKLWDISWGISTYKAAETSKVKAEPDFVQINFMGGVTAAEVIFGADTTKNYRNFTAANLEGVTFSGNRDVIGTSWRNLPSSLPGTLSIKADRFYLVRDNAGNIYCLSFLGGGSRGRPIIQYRLLQATTGV